MSQSDDEELIGSACYRGSTVRYTYGKLENYSAQLYAAGSKLRELEKSVAEAVHISPQFLNDLILGRRRASESVARAIEGFLE